MDDSDKRETVEKPATGPTGRPTLKTIAYMTGLGVTTVSRALNDAPDIGEVTKERVRLVAKQIGYRPNRAGVRLRTGRTNVISLVLSVETEVLGLTSHLVYGISEYLADTRYHLIVTPYNLGDDPLAPVRYVVETGAADGIIFSRLEPRDARVRYLHARGVPFATHGRTQLAIEHPYWDYDNTAFAEIAVARLAERGRRRLALLPPPGHLTYAGHMTAGFLAGVERAGATYVPVGTITTDSPYDTVQRAVAALMASDRRADGLVCGSAASAISVISGAESCGLVIGRDFDVAVKESFDLMRRFRRDVIVLREDFRAAGRGLAEAVVATVAGTPATDLQRIEAPS